MRKCTEMQTRNMIKVAATSTDVRRKKIMDLLRTINHNACPTLQQFGVNVATEFATIAARVLNPPQLEYAQKKSVTPAKGVWNASGYFLFPVTLSNWAVLTLDQRAHENDVRTFVERVSLQNNKKTLIKSKCTFRICFPIPGLNDWRQL